MFEEPGLPLMRPGCWLSCSVRAFRIAGVLRNRMWQCRHFERMHLREEEELHVSLQLYPTTFHDIVHADGVHAAQTASWSLRVGPLHTPLANFWQVVGLAHSQEQLTSEA